ncbi:MAG: threo-3-hydroxy-L-aspartate ammonia-lyase [Promethearchaeota archaeon]
MTAVGIDDVRAAARALAGRANRTPVFTSRTLDSLVGGRVFLKCENFQRGGSFKFRGAFNAVSSLPPERRAAGVVTHSSGNHAQALALAAKLLGARATVVVPEGAPACKVAATRAYGADVVFCEPTLEARRAAAAEVVERLGAVLVHPYDDDRVIAGAGTAALELLEEVRGLDAVAVPVGGGGLLSGTSVAAKGVDPGVEVYGVEPEAVDDAARSFRSGRVEANPPGASTVADGLRTTLCERTLGIIRANATGVVTVGEDAILAATRFAWERLKLVVEPSGAVPVAGLLEGAVPARGRRVGVVVSGGNVDVGGFFASRPFGSP